jgi:predicted metal-binding protein
MKKIGIIRCEKNMDRCPLTNCLRCLEEGREGFSIYDDCSLVGVFSCHCPGDKAVDLAKILKAKGAEAIHFCTCTFAEKTQEGWVNEKGGYCEAIDGVMEEVNSRTGLSCVKGTAHLPKGYVPKTWPAMDASHDA